MLAAGYETVTKGNKCSVSKKKERKKGKPISNRSLKSWTFHTSLNLAKTCLVCSFKWKQPLPVKPSTMLTRRLQTKTCKLRNKTHLFRSQFHFKRRAPSMQQVSRCLFELSFPHRVCPRFISTENEELAENVDAACWIHFLWNVGRTLPCASSILRKGGRRKWAPIHLLMCELNSGRIWKLSTAVVSMVCGKRQEHYRVNFFVCLTLGNHGNHGVKVCMCTLVQIANQIANPGF